MALDPEQLRRFAEDYTVAWCEVVPPAYAFMPSAIFAGDVEVEFQIKDGTALHRCRPTSGAKVTSIISLELAYGTPRGLIRQATLGVMAYKIGLIVADVREGTPEWNAIPASPPGP